MSTTHFFLLIDHGVKGLPFNAILCLVWTVKLEAVGPRHELLLFILTLAFLATKGLVQSFLKGVVALRPLVYPTFSKVTL